MKKKQDQNTPHEQMAEVNTMNMVMENNMVNGVNSCTEPVSVSTAKAKFLEYYRQATQGIEIITQKRNSENVSILSTAMVTAMLDAMKFTMEETVDTDLNVVTIAINEVPLYGEGESREAAINDLIDSTLEFLDIYQEQIEVYSKVDSPQKKVFMLKLLRCGTNRDTIRKTYGL